MLARFLAKRLLQLIPLLLIVTMVVFSLILLIPGDPTYAILGQEGSEEQREQLRKELGLDQPIHVQYARWLWNTVQGDLGRSLLTREKVADIVLRNAGATLQLVLFSVVLTVVAGILLGVAAVIKRGTIWETIVRMIGNLGVAIPSFVIAIFLVLIFSVKLRWLPATGFVNVTEDPVGFVKGALLPAIALGSTGVAIISRQIRSSLLEVLEQEYIYTALSKGMKMSSVIWRHGLRNALLPAVTTIGVLLSHMIGGTIILESIFVIPGLGQVLVNSILQRDVTLLQGAVLFLVLLVVMINFLVDLAYTLIDPRIKL
jgi:peptide/nickel transport system permease protein